MKVFRKFAIVSAVIVLLLFFGQADAMAADAEPAYAKTKTTIYIGNGVYSPLLTGVRDDATCTFKSSKPAVAEVDEFGNVTPVSVGSSTITATVNQNKKKYTAKIKITVKNPYYKITKQTEGILVGKSFTFEVKRYGYKGEISWYLEGSQYASIEAVSATKCKITGLKEGTASLAVESLGVLNVIELHIYEGKGEIYVVHPDSEPYYAGYSTRSDYNNKTKGYFLLRSYLERLEVSKGGVLVLAKGDYTVTNTLCVPSNTTIILEDGARIIKSDDTGTKNLTATGSLFQTVATTVPASGKVYSGYKGEHDIAFIGKGNATIDLNGVKSNAIAVCHMTNLTIQGISFLNMNSLHFIELDAAKNVNISNNSFANCKESPTLRKEAINIDAPDANNQSFNQSWTSMDGTPVVDAVIADNTFYNLEAGIGTHTYSTGGMHKNIQILRNQFINVTSYSICAMNWENCVVKDNTFERTKDYRESKTGVEIAVLVYGAKNPTITENYFNNCTYPIICRHWKNTGGGKIYDPVYNELSKSNITALQKNYVQNCENYKIKDYYDFNNLGKVKYYNISDKYILK